MDNAVWNPSLDDPVVKLELEIHPRRRKKNRVTLALTLHDFISVGRI